jgi:YD repeat-containing protein
VAVDTTNPNGPSATPRLAYRVKVTDAAGYIFSNTTTAYVADSDSAAPYFTPVAQVDASIDNGVKQTRTVYADYDAYGNLLRQDQSGDLSTASDRTVVGRSPTRPIGCSAFRPVRRLSCTPSPRWLNPFIMTARRAVPPLDHQTPTKALTTVRWLNGGTIDRMAIAMGTCLHPGCERQYQHATYGTPFPHHGDQCAEPGHDDAALWRALAWNGFRAGENVTDAKPDDAYEYDTLSRLTKTTAPDGLVTTTTYNYGTGFSVGTQHVLTSSSGAGVTTALTSANYFDGIGRSVKTESSGPDSATIVTELEYDIRGAVRKRSLPYFKTVESVTGRWSTLQYDALGRLTRLDLPDGTRSLACTSAWVTVSIDTANHRKRDTKDAYGRTVRVDEYQGTTSTCDTTVGSPYATTTYQYDTLGNLLSVTDAKGNVTTMSYDTLSRKTAMHDPDMGD